jgi:predicted MFS family arabinose efflux permease
MRTPRVTDKRSPEPDVSAMLRPPALAPFANRNFRTQWTGDLLTSWAFEMENLILGWYVLVETGSVQLLAAFGALLYVGTLVAPLIGILGDRLGHRSVLIGMRVVYTVLSASLMTLAFMGLLTPVLVLVIAGLVGVVRPSDLGVRGALIAHILPARQLMGAMGISRTTSDTARIAGSLAGAGLFAALGMGWAYVVVTAFYVAGLVLTCGVRIEDRVGVDGAPVIKPVRPSPLRDLGQGFLYVWRSPALLAGMCVAFLANLTAYPLSNGLLPYVAKDIYLTDQTGLAYLVAGFASGGLVGSLILSGAGARIPAGRMVLFFAVTWYIALAVFSQVSTFWAGFAALVVAGLSQSLSLVPLSVLLLKSSSEGYRGLVMGVRMLAIYGLPMGLLASGKLVEWFGFHVAALGYAVTGLVFVAVIWAIGHAHLWRRDAAANG